MMYGCGYGYGGPGFGLFHLLWFIALAVIVLYPLGTILRRIGFSPLWSVLVFVPIVNVVALWLVAFGEWPEPRQAGQPDVRPQV